MTNDTDLTRPTSSKAAAFRGLLHSDQLEFIMEAHNGMSAKIVQETGFKGIWGSGLTISAAMGVRDSNEASWTQVLEVLEFMSDATDIPILLDGDTGYGNFNNMRRLVTKLCQRDIAAVCIEDKLFPKTNSFIGEAQPLADIEEFCGKIKAGKDSQLNDDFSIVARIESLIAGRGMDDALRRGEAYHAAGADAVLIHSKRSHPDEILEFKRHWGDRCPVVIVPTMYYATPTSYFREADISLVIWANHNMRSAITAMRETSRKIYEEQTLMEVEDSVSTVREVFDIQGDAELRDAEKVYLPKKQQRTKAVILAASRGAALGDITKDIPKSMVDVRGRPLIHHLVGTLQSTDIGAISCVRGYRKEALTVDGVKMIDNDDYADKGEAASLACAADELSGAAVVAYGDILFRRYVVDMLLDTPGDIVLSVDARPRVRESARPADLVRCSRGFSGDYFQEEAPAEVLSFHTEKGDDGETHGEWIGLLRMSSQGAAAVREELTLMAEDGTLDKARLPDLLTRLMARNITVSACYVTGHWLDVDDMDDLAQARNFT